MGYSLYANFPVSVRASHFNFLPFVPPTPQEISDANITLNDFGKFASQHGVAWLTTGNGYFREQSTKVSTSCLLVKHRCNMFSLFLAKHNWICPTGQSRWSAFLDRGEISSLYVHHALTHFEPFDASRLNHYFQGLILSRALSRTQTY